jgi:hypothetical protein
MWRGSVAVPVYPLSSRHVRSTRTSAPAPVDTVTTAMGTAVLVGRWCEMAAATSTLYVGGDLATEVCDQLRAAQADLDGHVTACATGLCLACGVAAPCAVSRSASAVFAQWRRLPQRRPGASRPELVGARRVGGYVK